MSVTDSEFKARILELDNELFRPPTLADDLIALLEQVKGCLSQVERPLGPCFDAFCQLAGKFGSRYLIGHSDDNVKAAVACCLSEITRITEPNLPFDDDKMKEVFKLIVSSFEKLHDDSSRSYNLRVFTLEMVAKVRLCACMIDLECDGLIIEMFQHFFKAVRSFHQEDVFSYMVTVMNYVLEESEKVAPELLISLLAIFKKDNKVSPIAKELGKTVLAKSAAKLRPYLKHSVSFSSEEYDKVLLLVRTSPAVDQVDESVQEDPLSMSTQYEDNLGDSNAISEDGESPSNSSGVVPVPARKRRKTSKAWDHFDEVVNDTPRQQYYFDQEFSRKQLVEAIILHEYPLSIIDHVGFRNFVASVQPLFKMVSKNTVKKDIMKIFDNLKSKTFKLLEKITSRVAITTDLWTSDGNKKGFMAITCHFIDESWKLQSHILRFVPARHVEDALAGVLFKCLFDWNLEQKMSTITVDNSSTNNAMIKSLLFEKLSKRDLLMSKLFHVYCATDILNLIVQDGLIVISESVSKVRESVFYWIRSPDMIERFEEVAHLRGCSCEEKLSYDCPTRGKSTYLMLRTALKYKQVFKELSVNDRNYRCLPNEQQWNDIEIVCNELNLFYHGQISATTNDLGEYISQVCEIKLQLEVWVKMTDPPLIRSIAVAMLESFKKYWDEVLILMFVCAVFDPRYKMKLAEFFIAKMYGEGASTKIQEVQTYCYDLFQEYKTRFPHVPLDSSEASSSLSGGDRLSSFDRFVSSSEGDRPSSLGMFVASSGAGMNTKSELHMYLEEGLLPRAQFLDNLGWWNTHGFKYPTLCKMARDLLAIHVPFVASKSAFSTSGRLVSPHRSRLHPTTLEALMCTRTWLWNELNGLTSMVDSIPCPTLLDDEEKLDLYHF